MSNFVEYAYPYITKPVILNTEGQVEGLVMKGVDEKFSQKFLHEHLIAGDTIGRDEEGIALNDILLSEKIFPSFNVMILCAYCAISSSCVTSITVLP